MAHFFVCYFGDGVCAYILAQITGRETCARKEAGMGMGGLGELVWRAAKLWLRASVTQAGDSVELLIAAILQL